MTASPKRMPGCKATATRPRRRGVTMVEAILYLTISLIVIVFTLRVVDQQTQRQNEAIAAGEFNQIVRGSQLYVADRYDELRERLFDQIDPFADMLIAVKMDEVAAAGFLPPDLVGSNALRGLSADASVNGEMPELEPVILVRGVLRSTVRDPLNAPPYAGIWPDAVAVDHDSNPVTPDILNPALVNDRFDGTDSNPIAPGVQPTDDELDIEAIIVTTWTDAGGNSRELKASVANRIALESELGAVGYTALTDDTTPKLLIRGQGGWALDATKFEDLADEALRPTPGHLAAVIALPDYGAITTVGNSANAPSVSGLSLCLDLAIGTPEYAACISGGANAFYGDIIFDRTGIDTDGDGFPDYFPGIENVSRIVMADPEAVRTDGAISRADVPRIEGLTFLGMREPFASSDTPGALIDRFSIISDVSLITMAPPVDIDLTATTDWAFSEISGVSGVSCRNGGSTLMADGTMVFDCGETQLSQRLRISDSGVFALEGASRFAANVLVTDDLTLSSAATPDISARISDSALVFNDAGGERLRLQPTVLTGGRLDIEEANAGRLYVRGDIADPDTDIDVTENALQWVETKVVGESGLADLARFTIPICPADTTPFVELLSVMPPKEVTIVTGPTPTTLDVVDSVEVATWDADGDRIFYATIWMSESPSNQQTNSDCEWQCTSHDVGAGRDHGDCVLVGGAGNCPMSRVWKDDVNVDNPVGTRYSALVGCRPN